MKTRGKLAIEKPENDFKVVDLLLKDGLSRLMAVKDNAKLSAEQQKVFDSTFAQIRVLQAAMKECGDVERFAAPEVRNEQMGQTIARYDIKKLNGFDDVFGNTKRQTLIRKLWQSVKPPALTVILLWQIWLLVFTERVLWPSLIIRADIMSNRN